MNTLFYIFSSFALLSGIMVIQSRNPVHSVLFLILVFFNAAGLLLLLGLDFFAMIFLVVYVGGIAVLFLFVVMMLNIKSAEINSQTDLYGTAQLFDSVKIDPGVQGVSLMDKEKQDIKSISFLSNWRIGRHSGIGVLIAFLGVLLLLEIFLIIDNDLLPLVNVAHYFTYRGLQTDLKSVDSFPDMYLQYSHFINTYTNIESIGFLIYTVYFVFFLLASLILLVAMIGAIVLTMHKGSKIKRQQIFQQNSREFAKTVRKV